MVTKERRPESAEDAQDTRLETQDAQARAQAVASALAGAGNRELLDRLAFELPPARDPHEERPWLEPPEYGVASMLVGLRAPHPMPTDP